MFYYSFKIIPSLKSCLKHAYLHRSIDFAFIFDSACLGCSASQIFSKLLVFSVTRFKIDQNKNQNRSIGKVQNLGNERRYIYKDPRQDSGQRNISYTRYPKKCFTQIYRDLYGDAMLVLTRSLSIWWAPVLTYFLYLQSKITVLGSSRNKMKLFFWEVLTFGTSTIYKVIHF